MKTKFHEKYPFVTLLIGVFLVAFLYTVWPQGKPKKSELEIVEELPRYKIGEVIKSTSEEYKVTDLEFTYKSPEIFPDKLPDGLRYFVITVEVKNTGTAPLVIRCGKLEAVYEHRLLAYECNRKLSAITGVFSDINPQVKKTVKIYYEMPENVFGPFAWAPYLLSKVKFSVSDIVGAKWSDFSSVTKGAQEIDLTQTGDRNLIEKIKRFLRETNGLDDEKMGVVEYSYALIDLDGDGVNEVFFLRRGGGYCGSGGCALDVFRMDQGVLRATNISWMAGNKIWILPTKTNGMVDVSLGGPRMKFNGISYDVE